MVYFILFHNLSLCGSFFVVDISEVNGEPDLCKGEVTKTTINIYASQKDQ